jgi:hypothetical protein
MANHYKNLILSGGGVRGLYYLGFMNYYKDKLKDFRYFAGTSIGSFFIVGIALGYTSEEFKEHVLNILDYNRVKSMKVFDFLENLGIDDGSKMEHYVKKMIRDKIGRKDITFKELYDLYDKHVTITAVCVEDKDVIYFSKDTHPSMKVWKAIRMSMTVPFLFKPFLYKGKNYIDGGLRKNFPIDLFPISSTLGINISGMPKSSNLLDFEEYIFSIVATITNTKIAITLQDVITIDGSPDIDDPLSPFQPNIDSLVIEKAINYGNDIIGEFFIKKENEINTICQSIVSNLIDKI